MQLVHDHKIEYLSCVLQLQWWRHVSPLANVASQGKIDAAQLFVNDRVVLQMIQTKILNRKLDINPTSSYDGWTILNVLILSRNINRD